MREKLTFIKEYPCCSRITPASAGKTKIRLSVLCVMWDHPRECGKNKLRDNVLSPCLGSPPRVREKRDISKICDWTDRITPASAGKTKCIPKGIKLMRDHPRECGKNTAQLLVQWIDVGSPPRVREKRKLLPAVLV